MKINLISTAAPFFPKHILLSEEHKRILDAIKTRCNLSHNAAIRRGIDLVAKEYATEIKNPGAVSEA